MNISLISDVFEDLSNKDSYQSLEIILNYYSWYKKKFSMKHIKKPNWTVIHIESFLFYLQYMQLLLLSMKPLTKRIPKKPWRPFGTPLPCWWIWLRTFLTITRILCTRQRWPNQKSLETRYSLLPSRVDKNLFYCLPVLLMVLMMITNDWHHFRENLFYLYHYLCIIFRGG